MSELIIFLFLAPLFYYRIKNISWKKTISELFTYNKNLFEEIKGGIKLFGLLLIGFLIIAMSISIFSYASGIEFNDMEKVEKIVQEEITNNLPYFIILIFVGVLAEELFFRSFLVKKIGIFLSTIIFTFAHIGYGSIAEIIGVFFLGLILAYWYKKHNSIIQNYLGHLFYNLLAILLYVLI